MTSISKILLPKTANFKTCRF